MFLVFSNYHVAAATHTMDSWLLHVYCVGVYNQLWQGIFSRGELFGIKHGFLEITTDNS